MTTAEETITAEARQLMRERVIKYEQELRQEQSFCQPSQIIDREAVPTEVGRYTDKQIDRIIQLEKEVPAGSSDSLGIALRRFNVGA